MNASSPETVVIAVKTVFRGVAQVFFQENALTGVCFVLGIALNAPAMAAAALAGSTIGTVTASACRFERAPIAAGIYGFNAALVAIAMLFFFGPTPTMLALLVVGCIATTLLAWLLSRYCRFPTYTLAFILTTWILYYLGVAADLPQVQAGPGAPTDSLLAAIVRGVGQVKFQANAGTGLLFLLGIALNDWRHAVWVVVASMFSVLGAVFHNASAEGIALGLYGYNAPLTALALFLQRPSLTTPLLGILLCIPITEYVPLLGPPALTLPFVLTTWLVLALGKVERQLFRG